MLIIYYIFFFILFIFNPALNDVVLNKNQTTNQTFGATKIVPIVTNEEQQESIPGDLCNEMKKNTKYTWIGTSGLYNLNIISRTKNIEKIIICDIDKRMIIFWLDVLKEIKQANSNADAKIKIFNMIEKNAKLYFSESPNKEVVEKTKNIFFSIDRENDFSKCSRRDVRDKASISSKIFYNNANNFPLDQSISLCDSSFVLTMFSLKREIDSGISFMSTNEQFIKIQNMANNNLIQIFQYDFTNKDNMKNLSIYIKNINKIIYISNIEDFLDNDQHNNMVSALALLAGANLNNTPIFVSTEARACFLCAMKQRVIHSLPIENYENTKDVISLALPKNNLFPYHKGDKNTNIHDLHTCKYYTKTI